MNAFIFHQNSRFLFFLQKPTIENLDQAEEEFTLARLYLSKLKTEARSVSGVRSLIFLSRHSNKFLYL